MLLGGLVQLAGACASGAHGAAGGRARGVARPRLGRPDRGAPEHDYRVFVASEGNDRIALVRFGPAGIAVERERKIGTNPTELVGPHGLYVSPDGRWYYVSTAHGTPERRALEVLDRDRRAGRPRRRWAASRPRVQVAPGGALRLGR